MSLYKRPRSPFYWSKLYSAGSVVRFSTGERTKVKALRKERDKAEELKGKRRLEGRYSLATLAAKFLIWKEANKRSMGTVSSYEKHLELHVLPFFGRERDVRTIEKSDLEDYKASRIAKVTGQTVGKELSTIRQMLGYAVEVHRLMGEAPTVKNPTYQYEPKWRLLTLSELDRLLKALGNRSRRGWEALPYFLLKANTGMRGGEMSNLTWDMIDGERNSVFLPAWATKNRRARTVPLNDSARFALSIMHADHQIGRVFIAKNFYDSWRLSWREAGIGRVRPHDLRHTYGSLLHAAGRSQPEVRDILGHATLFMANLYAHTYQERLHEAVQAVQIAVPARVPLLKSARAKSAQFGQFWSKGRGGEKRKVI